MHYKQFSLVLIQNTLPLSIPFEAKTTLSETLIGLSLIPANITDVTSHLQGE